jgi:hypothetical protein
MLQAATIQPYAMNSVSLSKAFTFTSHPAASTMSATTTEMTTNNTAIEVNNKKRKQSIPPPFHYDEKLYSSYRFEWEVRKRLFPPPLQITSLCFLIEDNTLLAGTSLGTVMMYQQEEGDGREWKYLGEKKLGNYEITFLHAVSSSSKLAVVVFAGGLGGLWWWPIAKETMNDTIASAKESYKNLAVVQAQANDSHIYITTPTQTLFQIDLSLLLSDGENSNSIKPIDITLDTSPTSASYEITALHLTASLSGSENQWLLLGTDQSKVLCWDVNQQTFSKPLVLKDDTTSNTTTTTTRVTAMASIHPDWWTIAGITTEGKAKKENFVATWHGPTQSRIQGISNIRENIHGLLVFDNQLYSIGNENVLTVWDSPYQLEKRLHRIWTSAPSNSVLIAAASCSSSDTTAKNDVIAIAGVGCKIDLIQRHVCLQSLDLLQARQEVLLVEAEETKRDETEK